MKYNSNYYNSENFIPKFLKLLDTRYSKVEENQRKKHFINDYRSRYNERLAGFYRWLSYNDNQLPTLEKLMNICNILNCDIDYFLTEQEGFKKEIKSAAEVTGLEYETIEALQEIKNNAFNEKKEAAGVPSINILNFINGYVTTNNGKSFIHNLFMYMYAPLYIKHAPFKEENYYLGAVIEHITQTAMLSKIKLSEKNNDKK